MPDRKFLWIDTETTGLDSVKNDVIQMSGIIQINDKIEETFDIRCQPFDFSTITKEAYEKHKITEERLRLYQPPQEAYKEIMGIFGKYVNKYDKNDKFIPCGQNFDFDLRFMNQFFIKNGDKYFHSWTTHTGIDLMHLASILKAFGCIEAENLKLDTIAKLLGVSNEAHNALSDITATKQCVNKLVANFIVKGNGNGTNQNQ